MGCCNQVQSKPNLQHLDPLTRKKHEEIENQLQLSHNDDKGIKKLLLLGSGSAGKSTIFKQLGIIYDKPPPESLLIATGENVRGNCVKAILKLIHKTEELYEIDNKNNDDCHIDTSTASEETINSIKIAASFKNDRFDYYEKEYQAYASKDDNSDEPPNEIVEKQIKARKQKLQSIKNAIIHLWSLPQIKNTFRKRSRYAFSFPDNMQYFFAKERLDRIFEWNYVPTREDYVKVRQLTVGVQFLEYSRKGARFQIVDVGGQRNERTKWINFFEDVTAVIFVAALNHYLQVLFEDEKKNSMLESIEVFNSIINCKFFRKTSIILFLNKKDLFDQSIRENPNLSLNFCFNEHNKCVHIPYYDKQQNYWNSSIPEPNDYLNGDNKNKKKKKKEKVLDEELESKSMDEEYEKSRISSEIKSFSRNNKSVPDSLKKYKGKTAIYTNTELYYGNKNNYRNGKYKNIQDEQWFHFVSTDYLLFIGEQYKHQDENFVSQRQIYAHYTVATKCDNIETVFNNVQNILLRKNLHTGGLG